MFIQESVHKSEVVSESLDSYFQKLYDQKKFCGSVLLAKKGNLLLKKGYGYADIQKQLPNTPQTKFRIASITKQFTAGAILRLQEKKLLSIHDCIYSFIPEFPNGKNITTEQLLTHTSGIANYTDFEEYWNSATTQMDHRQTIERFCHKKSYFLPGEKAQYNNLGYVLLAVIVECVTNEPFITFLEKEFFQPLNMSATGFADQKKKDDHAEGYVFKDSELISSECIDMAQQSGAGFLYSTVEDLFTWHTELQNPKKISINIIEHMHIPRVPIQMKNWKAD